MKKAGRSLLIGILVATAGTFSFAVDKDAQGFHPHSAQWRQDHPRQAEVMRRARRERSRINKLYKDGKITAQERDQELAQVKDVVKEDKADNQANMNGNGVGYVTKGQQQTMNQQENQINQQLKTDVNGNQPPTTPAPAGQ